MCMHSLNSPDAEVEEVKCINKVMDEVVPDGIGSSDSDDGEMTINNIIMYSCVYICMHTIIISHNVYILLQYSNSITVT